MTLLYRFSQFYRECLFPASFLPLKARIVSFRERTDPADNLLSVFLFEYFDFYFPSKEANVANYYELITGARFCCFILNIKEQLMPV